MVWFGEQGTEGRLGEGLCVRALPCLRNWCDCTLHLVLNGLVSASASVILRESNLESTVDNGNASETEIEVQVLIILNQISYSQEDSVEGICNDLLAKKASGSNRYRVAIDHTETLLEN